NFHGLSWVLAKIKTGSGGAKKPATTGRSGRREHKTSLRRTPWLVNPPAIDELSAFGRFHAGARAFHPGLRKDEPRIAYLPVLLPLRLLNGMDPGQGEEGCRQHGHLAGCEDAEGRHEVLSGSDSCVTASPPVNCNDDEAQDPS